MSEWREQAACRGMDPDIFYPPPGPKTTYAAPRAVCRRCPVRQECLDAVIPVEPEGQRFGMVGGLTPAERQELSDQRRGMAS